jgi:hypothetical protein
MSDDVGYGKRIRRALRVWASQFETATYEEFGQRVAAIEGRDPAKGPYRTSAVSEWLQNRSEPSIATFKAIEALTGFRAAWLMLGELPERVDDRGGEGDQGAKVEPHTPIGPSPADPTPPKPPTVHRIIPKTLDTRRVKRPKREKPDRRASAG